MSYSITTTRKAQGVPKQNNAAHPKRQVISLRYNHCMLKMRMKYLFYFTSRVHAKPYFTSGAHAKPNFSSGAHAKPYFMPMPSQTDSAELVLTHTRRTSIISKKQAIRILFVFVFCQCCFCIDPDCMLITIAIHFTARCIKLLILVFHYTLVLTSSDKSFLNSPLKFLALSVVIVL